GRLPGEPQEHRPEEVVCDRERPAVDAGLQPGAPEPSDIEGACVQDSDCTDGFAGRCVNGRGMLFCSYDECTTDSECEGTTVCDCGLAGSELTNSCVAGNCRVDDDCGEGGYCSPSQGSCGSYSGVVAYWCHTPEDECLDDSDCDVGYCALFPEIGIWACQTSQCVG